MQKITPAVGLVPGDDPAKVKRVTSKVWQMTKLDLAELERAAEGDGL